MDLSAYAALGGVERVAVIIGALIVGYWGYRLYGRDKTPGLVFMGIACVVLVLALATGGAYLRSVGTSYQLAGASPEPDAADQQVSASDDAGMATAADQRDAEQPSRVTPLDTKAATSGPASASPEASATPEPVAEAPAAAEPAPDEPASGETVAAAESEAAQTGEANSATDDVDLASSQELGGRIVSVKSDKVTLEWSRE